MSFKVGDRVNHCYFGVGTVISAGGRFVHVKHDDGTPGAWLPTNLEHVIEDLRPFAELYKQKSGKPRWSLILDHVGDALKEVIKVREYGCSKYEKIAQEQNKPFDPQGWQKVPSLDYADSAVRHLQAYMTGEKRNSEDGDNYHLAQAAIDCLFALSNDLRDSK